MNFHKKEGFTLIELLVVITILGILVGTALPRVVNMEARSQDAKIAVVAGSIRSAMELYHQEHGGYPSDGENGEPGPANITVESWSGLNEALVFLELEDMSEYNIGSAHVDIGGDDVFFYNVKDDGSYEIQLASNSTGTVYLLHPDGFE